MINALSDSEVLMDPEMLKDRIKEAMEGAGLKPLQLAHATGRTSGAVTQWTDGTTKTLKADTAAKIEEATGYSATWLVTGQGPKKRPLQAPPMTKPKELSPGAIELAELFDMIPISERVLRITTFNQVSGAILQALQKLDSNAQTDQRS